MRTFGSLRFFVDTGTQSVYNVSCNILLGVLSKAEKYPYNLIRIMPAKGSERARASFLPHRTTNNGRFFNV